MYGKFFWSIGDALRNPFSQSETILEDEAVVEDTAGVAQIIGFGTLTTTFLISTFLVDRHVGDSGYPITFGAIAFFLTLASVAAVREVKTKPKRRKLSQPRWLKISLFFSVTSTIAVAIVWGIVGIVGAFIGGWLAGVLHINIGGGLISTIITATVGAVLLILIVRMVKKGLT